MEFLISNHSRTAKAPSTSAAEIALLMFRAMLALLTDDFPELCTDDAVVGDELVVPVPLAVAGATAANAPTVDHLAAELAAVSPWV